MGIILLASAKYDINVKIRAIGANDKLIWEKLNRKTVNGTQESFHK